MGPKEDGFKKEYPRRTRERNDFTSMTLDDFNEQFHHNLPMEGSLERYANPHAEWRRTLGNGSASVEEGYSGEMLDNDPIIITQPVRMVPEFHGHDMKKQQPKIMEVPRLQNI